MEKINVKTTKQVEFVDITEKIRLLITGQNIETGHCTIFVPHTTAGITINENADPCVRRDIIAKLNKVIPLADNYTHSEGNSAAHIKASLLGFSLHVLIEKGTLQLGTWQGIYFAEFDGPRSRQVWVSIV